MLLAGATAITGTAQSKFDAAGMMVMDTYAARLQNPTANLGTLDLPGGDAALSGRADARATVFVSLHEGASADDVEIRGFDIISDFGDILIASGSMDDIQALSECDFVKAISFGHKVKPALKEARAAIDADEVHDGTDLLQAYKGKGVITSFFDNGLDPNHANFLNSDKTSRIAKLWHFSQPGRYKEYTQDQISTFTTDSRTETHATHVLGCMAGSFNEAGGKVVTSNLLGKATVSSTTPNPYYGLAPESEIVAACGTLYNQSIITAAEQIANYVKESGKPAVFNLSLGGSIGSHDETDPTNQILDRLGNDMIICIASGNEGDLKMSIDHTFTNGDTEFKTLFGSDDQSTRSASGYIDIWSNSSTPFTVTAFLYDRSTGKMLYEKQVGGGNEGTESFSYSSDESLKQAYSSGRVQMTAAKNSTTNNRYNVLINVSSMAYNRSTNANRTYMLGFKVSGVAGQRIMMTTDSENAELTNSRAAGFEAGSGVFSINSMACGKNIIAVGAFTTKDKWGVLGDNGKGATLAYNDPGLKRNKVSSFSSYGTLADGRNLPDVCAPGANIVSSVSNYYAAAIGESSYLPYLSATQDYNGRTNYWEAQQGTSMASPVCAGTIALWLEANPYLKVDDVKKIIVSTSVKDSNVTGHDIPVQWGAGKLNAYEGLKMAIQMAAGVNDVSLEGQDKLIVTPNGVNSWEVYAPYASSISADIYSLAGSRVASAKADGNTLSLSADGLAKGIYVISVNGTDARRIVVR